MSTYGICAMRTGTHGLWVSRRGQESGVSVLAEEGAEVPVGHEGHDNGGPRQPLNDHAQQADDVAMVELLHNHNLLHHLLHISHSEEPCGTYVRWWLAKTILQMALDKSARVVHV